MDLQWLCNMQDLCEYKEANFVIRAESSITPLIKAHTRLTSVVVQ